MQKLLLPCRFPGLVITWQKERELMDPTELQLSLVASSRDFWYRLRHLGAQLVAGSSAGLLWAVLEENMFCWGSPWRLLAL